MKASGSLTVSATPEAVWQALCDPEVLREAIPHCETFNRVAGMRDVYDARLSAHAGRLVGHFSVRVSVFPDNPPQKYRLRCEAAGGGVGSAQGGAIVKLEPEGAATRLSYQASLHLTGALHAVPEGLIQGTFERYARHFFTKLEGLLTHTELAAEPITLPSFRAPEPTPRRTRKVANLTARQPWHIDLPLDKPAMLLAAGGAAVAILVLLILLVT